MANRALFVSCFFLLCLTANACSAVPAQRDRNHAHQGEGHATLTAYQLNSKLLAFSDNFQESISETVDEILARPVSSQQRLGYQTIKVFYTSAVVDIATESDAIKQLIDMLVMLRLQRVVWESGGHDFSEEPHSKLMSARLRKLEKNLMIIALQVFEPDTIKTIQDLAENWREENSDREYIAYVRFQDFADTYDDAELLQSIPRRGLLATVSEANQQIEETRHAFERALFLANHLPIMLEWQAELFLFKTLGTAEITDLMRDVDSVVSSTAKIASAAQQLPQDINGLIGTYHKPMERLTENVAVASSHIAVAAESLGPFLNSDSSYTPEQSQAMLKDMVAMSKELAKVAEAISGIDPDSEAAIEFAQLINRQIVAAGELLQSRITDTDERLRGHRERIFFMLLVLSVVFPVCFFGAYVIAKRHVIAYEANRDGDSQAR